jgi:hypothetical protein
MRPVVRIHGLLGTGSDSGPAGVASALRLPGGTSATRWLSRGLSRPRGLGAEIERCLNADDAVSRHCVLDLRDPAMDLVSLTDELDPRWNRGLPAFLSALVDLSAQLPELGAKGEFGVLALDCPGEDDARRLRKIWAWCRSQRMGLAVRGDLPPLGLDHSATVNPRDGADGLASAIRGLVAGS